MTNPEGSYSFHVQKTNMRCFVQAYAPSTKENSLETFVDIGTDDTTVPTFTFTPVGIVDGTVHVASASAAGVFVSVEGTDRVATTDADGHYHIEGVPTGTRVIHFDVPGRPSVDVTETVVYARTTTVPTTAL